MQIRIRSFATMLALLSVGGSALAADLATSVSGVVRNAQGTPQMGVLVELLRGSVVATALTDLQGRYRLPGITPGMYDLRTSAALALPTLHRSLRVRAGAISTVNLTLTGLFDDASWVTLPHHTGRGDVDDWKWTLRSPANRPMLRVLDDDGDSFPAAIPEMQSPRAAQHRATLTSAATTGRFGAGGVQTSVAMGRQSADRRSSDTALFSVGSFQGGAAAAGTSALVVHESGVGAAVERRMLVGMRSVPQLRTQTGEGLTVLEVDTAERMEVGSMAALEVGGQTQMLHAGGTVVVLHPFVRASAHAGDVWLVQYAYATAPESGAMESLSSDRAMTRLPTLVAGREGLQTEAGSHQEFSVKRSLGRTHVEAAAFHDAEQRTALNGQLTAAGFTGNAQIAAGMAVDASNGAVRWLVPGFTGSGVRMEIEAPCGERGRVLAAYLNGVGLGERAGAAIASRRSSAMYVAVKREMPRTGTQIAVSYRWQPAAMLTTVGRYEQSDVSPYLGFHAVQALPLGRGAGWHSELVLDATNVLGEGYRSGPELAPDLLVMSALRELRAGLSVSF